MNFIEKAALSCPVVSEEKSFMKVRQNASPISKEA